MPSIDFNGTSVQNIELDSNGNLVFRDENGDEYTWVGPGGFFGGDDYHYAGDFDGADADARLDNALAAASNGDTIYPEAASYGSRTISQRISLAGGGQFGAVEIASGATWTITGSHVEIRNVTTQGTLRIEGFNTTYQTATAAGTITVAANNAKLLGLNSASITFEAGASNGIVDACTGTTVTDNDGGNAVGDTT